MIAIVDYGMGNIRSVEKGFLKIGANAKVTSDPKVISDSKGIVLPGVGAFRDCIKNLNDLKLLDAVIKEIHKGKPYLGICLGMQILFTESAEFGVCKGLDIFKGKVVKFAWSTESESSNFKRMTADAQITAQLKIPHMGWNIVKLKKRLPIFNGIEDNSYFYFVHSYYVVPDSPEVIAGTTSYGIDFTSMVCKDNVFATQFHPEKSQDLGLRILKGFSDFVHRS